ncbi:hypothetical protein DHC50_18765 [Arenibacter sp. A80]|nr:hypothetical protein [Arenibacter sp. A80]RFT54794.1 hypothetical protein D0S24_18760 [Arenibacter sp. P308M17]
MILLDNRDLIAPTLARQCRSDGPARAVQAGVEIKLEFPFNDSWACLCRQTGLPRGSLLVKDYFFEKQLKPLPSKLGIPIPGVKPVTTPK